MVYTPPSTTPEPEPSYSRDTVKIPSLTPGWNLDAWRYLPASVTSAPSDQEKSQMKRVPVVVMAHGLSGNKTMALDPYATAFARAGYAAIVFDYRRWGDSDGTPRCAVVVKDQLDDYRTVIRWITTQPSLDASRVVVWGTSFAGGHALALASDPNLRLAGAIAQCPFTGVFPKFTMGLFFAVMLAFWDLMCRAVRKGPVYVRAAAEPGQAGAMTVHGSVEGMFALSGEWVNRITAASVFQVPLYDPSSRVKHIAQPTLLVPCVDDQIFTWNKRKNKFAKRAPKGRVTIVECEGDHWCVYPGQKEHTRSLEAQLTFLRTNVPL